MSTSGRVLVTGATGFVGRALLARLAKEARPVTAAVRDPARLPTSVRAHQIKRIGPDTEFGSALADCEAVVHLAARVHVMRDESRDPLADYRDVNVAGTITLARQAARNGVRRFVYMSSIKVNGEATRAGEAFDENQTPAPTDPYGISKLEAERALFDLAAETGMEVVVVRPPLVYGPGVGANFLSMMRWLARRRPLPLGAVRENRRSLVGLDNLVDFLLACLHQPAAANEVFVVSDGEDLSTAGLLERTAAALSVRARLVPVPVLLLAIGAAAVRKRGVFQRLCGNLQVDIDKARRILAWQPPFSVDHQLHRAASTLSADFGK